MGSQAAQDTLSALRALAEQLLDASRGGDLDGLERVEAQRRALIAALDPGDLAALATADPDGLAAHVAALERVDRLVRSRLQGRLAQLTRAMEQDGARHRAERRYRQTP